MARRQPNILLIAIDSLRRDHMSLYGYHHNTTPHIDAFARECTVFTETICPHIPTTSAYASMLTGGDCFTTQVVALRHQGDLAPKVRTLAEICRDNGYETTCVGFTGNPSARGFDHYLDYKAWGNWNDDRYLPKAQLLNDVAQPEIQRLGASDKPWFMMLRHMDPHSPYLPPQPFERMFYHGDPCDPAHTRLEKCYAFKPFADYFLSWFPPDCTDVHYIRALYDGAVAYMDSCLQAIFTQLETMGILDDTIVVLNGDHGETLDEHEYWFDHHGLHEPNLVVPLLMRYPEKLPMGAVVTGANEHKDLVPTLVELAGLKLDATTAGQLDGQSLMKLVRGEEASFAGESYITECTWMRKHGWRTPQWKLIVALEPDFHFMPPVELYDLITDPQEDHNVADEHPEVVAMLRQRMDAWIARREKETGSTNPMLTQACWHGHQEIGPAFASSEQAYETMHIGSAAKAAKLQARDAAKNQEAAEKPADKTPDATGAPAAGVFATIIGRGHGGTRAISHTLAQSGFYMGNTLNASGDLLPPEPLYEACRVISRHVRHLGGLQWDFSALHTMKIDPAFTRLIEDYLQSVLNSPARLRGWKIPETTLIYPWIVRMFPELHYIHWVRDPRDAILSGHKTDDLAEFGVVYDKTDDLLLRRAISWKYQAEIVRATPRPARFLTVRFEDFVLDQPSTLGKLGAFLGEPLVAIPVRRDSVGRWRNSPDHRDFDFLQTDLRETGYLDGHAVGKSMRTTDGH